MVYIRRVVGKSMHPTFREGQVVIALKRADFAKGEIVVAKMDGREVIKRIARISGEKYWLEGDNKTASTDSRTHGWVLKDEILGKIFWPKS